MKRAEREQILKQGVVSAETPRARRERETLQEDVRASGMRTITEMIADQERRLAEAWSALAAESSDGGRFAEAWQAELERWSFDEVNDLIDRHNRYYPAESRLRMDPRTKDYALVAGQDYRRRPLDAAWALERFPASLERARVSA